MKERFKSQPNSAMTNALECSVVVDVIAYRARV